MSLRSHHYVIGHTPKPGDRTTDRTSLQFRAAEVQESYLRASSDMSEILSELSEWAIGRTQGVYKTPVRSGLSATLSGGEVASHRWELANSRPDAGDACAVAKLGQGGSSDADVGPLTLAVKPEGSCVRFSRRLRNGHESTPFRPGSVPSSQPPPAERVGAAVEVRAV